MPYLANSMTFSLKLNSRQLAAQVIYDLILQHMIVYFLKAMRFYFHERIESNHYTEQAGIPCKHLVMHN